MKHLAMIAGTRNSSRVYRWFFYWLYEAPRASGPLSQLCSSGSIPPQASRWSTISLLRTWLLRVPLLSSAQCWRAMVSTAPSVLVKETEAQMLTCRRHIEGRRYCDRINYLAYETTSGAIIQSIGVIAPVSNRNRVLGRCLYTEPSPED